MELSEYPERTTVGVGTSKRKRREEKRREEKRREEKRRESHCPFTSYSHQ
jgi:hypothetical protein